MPAPTATTARPIGTTAATSVPKTTTRTRSATSSPMPTWPVSSSALRNTASPPSSTSSPGTSTPDTASESTVNAGLPSSRCGASRVASANPIRPSGETVSAANGSLTDATWSRVATSASTASTSARWLSSVWPSSAAKTTRTLPWAASGKPSSSRSRARALWLSGALNSSAKVPPPAAASRKTVPITRTQPAMVRQGCRALVIAMPRVNLSMIVPLRCVRGRCSWTQARDRCGER